VENFVKLLAYNLTGISILSMFDKKGEHMMKNADDKLSFNALGPSSQNLFAP